MNLAAIVGGITVATFSQRIGRRRAIVAAALLSLPVLPLWAFARDPLWIGVGAFLMQFCVQGAWGVIPAHLNEISPPELRATFPGVTYQLGNLLAAGNATLPSSLADNFFGGKLNWPLALMVGTVAVSIAVLIGFGAGGAKRANGPRASRPVGIRADHTCKTSSWWRPSRSTSLSRSVFSR